MKKVLEKAIAVVLTSAIALTVGIPAFAETNSSEPEVKVQVYVNSYDEDYIKNIEFDDGTAVGDYNYSIEYVNKVTRDPNLLPLYFDFVGWIVRTDAHGHDLSLSLDPNIKVRYDGNEANRAWNALSDPWGGAAGNTNWPTNPQKLKTFHWQFDCHFVGGKEKDRWNIEPTRSANSYVAVLAAHCNPF